MPLLILAIETLASSVTDSAVAEVARLSSMPRSILAGETLASSVTGNHVAEVARLSSMPLLILAIETLASSVTKNCSGRRQTFVDAAIDLSRRNSGEFRYEAS